MVPWQFPHLLHEIRENTTVPVLTGEDIYLKEDFIKLIDAGAVDMIHPDLASSGGLIETKKIGDYAMEHGVAMAMHSAGTPISLMAPEQLEGNAADARTDVFAFGAVLFEMMAGRKAFEGRSQASLIAAILEHGQQRGDCRCRCRVHAADRY